MYVFKLGCNKYTNQYVYFIVCYRHIEVTTAPNYHFVFTVRTHHEIPRGTVGFSLPQRKWATLSLNQEIEVRPYHFDPTCNTECLCNIVLEADFLQKKTYVNWKHCVHTYDKKPKYLYGNL